MGHSSWRRAALLGVTSAAVCLGLGALAELWWLGPTNDALFAKVERQVQQRFAAVASLLDATAESLASNPEIISRISGDRDALRHLFEITGQVAAGSGQQPDLAITIYGPAASARAWSGRPSEIPRERILGAHAFFITPSPSGPRLVHVEPVMDPPDVAAPDARRLGSVATEWMISPATGVIGPPAESARFATPLAAVTLRMRYEGGGAEPGPRSFVLRAPTGELLLEAQVPDEELAATRAAWRRTVWNLTFTLLAVAVLLGALPLLALPRPGLTLRHAIRIIALVFAGFAVAYGLLRSASAPAPDRLSFFAPELYTSIQFSELLRSPADLFLLGLLLAGVVAAAAHLVDRTRLAARRARRPLAGHLSSAVLGYITGGTLLALVLLVHAALVSDTVAGAGVSLSHTSLHPWDTGRLGLLAGLVLAHAAAVWTGILLLVAADVPWRGARDDLGRALLRIVAWLSPGALLAASGWAAPLPLLIPAGGCVAGAWSAPAIRPWFRHASQGTRLLALFLALLLPALLMYPLVIDIAERSKRCFIENQYAEEAARLPEELQAQLARALDQIDRFPTLSDMTAAPTPSATGRRDTDRAFALWRQTDLARLRLTSAIELYAADGTPLSRFALNFPEYAAATQQWQVTGCDWEVFGEVLPFGAQERRVLHAERAVCTAPADEAKAVAHAGAVVVHVARDYQTLPFIASTSPYVELLRPEPLPRREGSPGQDVELVTYGWGGQTDFTSGQSAWVLDNELFDRISASREVFWTTLDKDGRDYHIYFINNRAGIYALGYPALDLFDHFVRLAETAALVFLLFVGFVLAATLGGALAPERYRFGRALYREVRTSFYRRLFLAFVAVAVIPVLALALVIRNYFTAQLRADVEAGAARTAAVAQRVIEDLFVLQQIGEQSTAVINDDLLIWISQIIDQGVNIFDGSQLVATSERDLFASGLLPTRTPDAVYHAIALDQTPSYVAEDTIGSLAYLVAATPIRAAGDEAILTVPLASRQQEIEHEIDDLDRGILLGVTLFVLVGAWSGFYMAERIADPVKRLTRATGRIARGDFDEQIAVKSADELQQLVIAFNRMAVDLKRQQQKLERTHRLEAWAEMARQVAHEIKNPLTPVQLSAEHLLRVHTDRGEPMSPVLQGCVKSILAQVRILRQISAEFSSYASSPTVRRDPTALAELVDGVLGPYLVGLEGRIAVSVDMPATLPSLSLDRTLVERALTNLIDNALHAMPGQGSLTVRAQCTVTDVTLRITDTGVGLDEPTLGRIFEPYFSTRVSGTGLGMAIAKRNVELNGGTIAVESQKGHGTTVTLTFPLDVQADRELVGPAG